MKTIRQFTAWLAGLRFTSHLLILLGFTPRTLEECRFFFKNAHPPRQPRWKGLKMFTPLWEATYRKWVDLCPSEKETRGAFFSGYEYSFGEGKPNPLNEYCIQKWVPFLNSWNQRDYSNSPHINTLARLTGDWGSQMIEGKVLVKQHLANLLREMLAAINGCTRADYDKAFHVFQFADRTDDKELKSEAGRRMRAIDAQNQAQLRAFRLQEA